ncbi:MAG: hypothetical protein C0500_01995 [Sphingobium sp.]|nr:hypothetical protein [Sphingobium sp.]
MMQGETSRRALIKSAVACGAALGPLGLLGGCSNDLGSASALSVVPEAKGVSFAAAATASKAQTEAEYWSAAVGQTFKITGPEGPMYGTLTSVVALAIEGERPADLRPQPMTAVFTFDRRDNPLGELVYALVKGNESESSLYLQRGGTVEAPTLVAQFN